MNNVVALIALLLVLAGCTSSPDSTSAAASPSAAATSSASATLLTCPPPPAGVPVPRVVARDDVTLRDRPGRLADGARVLGLIPGTVQGADGKLVRQLVELKAKGQGPWRQIACGEVGWALADNSQTGADHTVWLEPVS